MAIYITRQMIDPAFEKRDRDENTGFFRRLFRSAVRRWHRGRMIAALQAMDDALLKDIGIYRGDIPRMVDGLDDRELRMAPVASTATSAEAEDEAYRKAA